MTFAPPLRLALCALLAAALLGLPEAHAECTPVAAPAASPDADHARTSLLALLSRARANSQAVGAARLLAEAARLDAEETRASGLPQASLSLQMGAGGSRSDGAAMRSGSTLRPSLNLGAPLWDAGRQQQLETWRERLADAAREGLVGAEEQLALQVVQLSLERGRLRLQAQVQERYLLAVCQLVSGLEQIVASDRGRASELLQARKTWAQARLAAEQVRVQQRLADQRLARFTGPELPDASGLSALLLSLPEPERLSQGLQRNADLAALLAQQRAAEALAEATAAGQRPQASWQLSASTGLGHEHSASWQAGVVLNVPLYAPAQRPALDAARRRADAARLQREDTRLALASRIDEARTQAEAAFARAREVAAVAAQSQQVRDDTLQMWRQLGRRSLFDLLSAEADHVGLRLAQVDALSEGQQAVALAWSLAGGVQQPLAP